jgi:hypothetical protein
MELPLPLSDQQRKQIYDVVTADNSQPVAGADALKPASELSPNQRSMACIRCLRASAVSMLLRGFIT